MPTYSFICDTNQKGCGHQFSLFMSMTTYTNKQKCPQCNKQKSVRRDYDIDLPTLSQNIKLNDDNITVGHLAKRNSERLSSDEKDHLTEKHNAYKYEEPTKPLPKGMNRMGSLTKKHKNDSRRNKHETTRTKT